ncbi:MAG: DrmE family protein [Candidatus Omnitrophota bacterium]
MNDIPEDIKMRDRVRVILSERFPMFGKLAVQKVRATQSEAMPPYIGMILAAMETPSERPICFVFPRRGEAGRLAAALYGISNFVKKCPGLAVEYAKAKFSMGQRLRVMPSRHVYVFDGVANSGFIWLKVIDDGRRRTSFRTEVGRRMFPAIEALRLEPTSGALPKGKLGTALRNPPTSPLDDLIGIKIYGNRALFHNEVLLLDSLNGFTSFTEDMSFLRPSKIEQAVPLKDLFPFGSLRRSNDFGGSWLSNWDQLNSTGEPIVAVTHSAALLADYCRIIPAKSKLVVANSFSPNDLQSYDDIAQSQRLAIFLDSNETEMIELLAKRNCDFWWFENTEISHAGKNGDSASNGVIALISRCSENKLNLSIDQALCRHDILEEAHELLCKLSASFIKADDNPLTRLVMYCWRVFSEARNYIDLPSEGDRDAMTLQLKQLREEMGRSRAWIPPESGTLLKNYILNIEKCYEVSGDLGRAKGDALKRAIADALQGSLKFALVVKSENKVVDLRSWLSKQGFKPPIEIFSTGAVPADKFFDRLICVSWFNSTIMTNISNLLTAPNILVVSYPFEFQWLKQFKARMKKRQDVQVLDAESKATIINGGVKPQFTWPYPQSLQKVVPQISGIDILALESRLLGARIGSAARSVDVADSVMARYVKFSGDFYTFLTDSHKVPVVTGLLSSQSKAEQGIPEKTVADIRTGDFLVFPDSGERELVQGLADKILGNEAPILRAKARVWKQTLQNCGLTPEQFHLEAYNLKRPRHIMTIRNWFANTAQIGPQSKEDLILIALVTNNKELLDGVEGIQQAIDRLRGCHLSAGMYLRNILLQRLPQVMGNIQESGSKVDIGDLGSAWIVQAEYIEQDFEPRGRYEVNRLLTEKLVGELKA